MRRVVTWAALAALAMGATGCWFAPGQGPDRNAYSAIESGFDAESVAGFTQLWGVRTDGGAPRGVGNPIVSAHGTVHVTTAQSV